MALCVRSILTATLCLVLTGVPLTAAPQSSTRDPIEQARYLATHGQRPAALDLLAKRLVEKPEDVDARVVYAIILSWEGSFDQARSELQRVLSGHPGYTDALIALVNVELWSDHPGLAERIASQALKNDPNNPNVILAMGRVLKAEKRNREAADLLMRLLTIDPGDEQARKLIGDLKEGPRLWEAGFDHSFETFSDGRAPWQETEVSLKRQTPFGSFITRYSHAGRSPLGSNQIQEEAYPRIRRGSYAFLNFGLSPDATLYPHYRAGAEIYQSLKHGWEASAGYRWLDFRTRVHIFTPSVTKYYANWMFTGRVYLTPDSAGTSRSFQILARRYFGEGSNYLAFRYGWGASVAETPSLGATRLLGSSSYYGELNWTIRRNWRLNLRGAVYLDDQLNRSSLQHYLSDATLYYRF